MHDWVYREFFAEISDCKDEKDFSRKLADENRSFAVIRGIANASKHMTLSSSTAGGVQSTAALSVRWAKSGFIGPFDGGLHVIVETDLGYEIFGRLAHNVLSM
jgi:hypothetical protein